jgi:hypothetical protein
MMEIPAGKFCDRCQWYHDDIDWPNGEYCGLYDEVELEIDRDDERSDVVRCPACLAAYPNGATITVIPK